MCNVTSNLTQGKLVGPYSQIINNRSTDIPPFECNKKLNHINDTAATSKTSKRPTFDQLVVVGLQRGTLLGHIAACQSAFPGSSPARPKLSDRSLVGAKSRQVLYTVRRFWNISTKGVSKKTERV